mmetsp:Transcript_3229/g.9917  ORF Transcript_3229/g.9917 Transcript_3229/m.9917 type:complete len:83 (-) Transcript_3229:436-684(-)
MCAAAACAGRMGALLWLRVQVVVARLDQHRDGRAYQRHLKAWSEAFAFAAGHRRDGRADAAGARLLSWCGEPCAHRSLSYPL